MCRRRFAREATPPEDGNLELTVQGCLRRAGSPRCDPTRTYLAGTAERGYFVVVVVVVSRWVEVPVGASTVVVDWVVVDDSGEDLGASASPGPGELAGAGVCAGGSLMTVVVFVPGWHPAIAVTASAAVTRIGSFIGCLHDQIRCSLPIRCVMTVSESSCGVWDPAHTYSRPQTVRHAGLG